MSADIAPGHELRFSSRVIVPDETSRLPSTESAESPYARQNRLRKMLGGNPSSVIVPTEASKLPDGANPLTADQRLQKVLRARVK